MFLHNVQVLESLGPIVLGGEKKQVIRVEKLFVIDVKTMAKLTNDKGELTIEPKVKNWVDFYYRFKNSHLQTCPLSQKTSHQPSHPSPTSPPYSHLTQTSIPNFIADSTTPNPKKRKRNPKKGLGKDKPTTQTPLPFKRQVPVPPPAKAPPPKPPSPSPSLPLPPPRSLSPPPKNPNPPTPKFL